MTQAQDTTNSMIALYDELHATIARRGALCILYCNEKQETKPRVIVPDYIKASKGADLVICWDSIRKSTISLRLDRISDYHALPVKNVA